MTSLDLLRIACATLARAMVAHVRAAAAVRSTNCSGVLNTGVAHVRAAAAVRSTNSSGVLNTGVVHVRAAAAVRFDARWRAASVIRALAAACALGVPVGSAWAQGAAVVYAAGSLRAPLTDAAAAFEAQQPGAKLQLVFGASGLLKDRIVAGEPAQVFASANMEHPRALAAAGGWRAVSAFARNSLCALAHEGMGLTASNLIERLLDPKVRVGTSTPRADPSGDYAFEMFARIGQLAGAPPDARSILEHKALQLTGGPNSPPPPVGRSVYGALVAEGQADIFITYCTNAAVAIKEQPQLRAVTVPAGINVSTAYGLTVRNDASALSSGFAAFLLAPQGQAVLARHGFEGPR